jgi:glutamate racemase
VPLVEKHETHTPQAEAVVKKYMDQVNAFHPDVLIHGCSHYPYLEFQMKKFCHASLQFLDPAVPVVEQAKKILEIQDELNTDAKAGSIHYFSSKYDAQGHYLIKETPELFGVAVV